ncbi:hypothetical protein LAUMK4_04347 [Mycobacterium persicum]|uniref:Uncharacterized protein n=1 Tax=Mycobacterium persicum TaxID=1487726 RepID=A0ABY6RNL0_9MYCO|nr:hypothetical protein LAUMK15_04757 [Mycobacterium persicum]VAZ98790.1 hypothetical protein LAUMK4_04347 [Mycobacterium persicum]
MPKDAKMNIAAPDDAYMLVRVLGYRGCRPPCPWSCESPHLWTSCRSPLMARWMSYWWPGRSPHSLACCQWRMKSDALTTFEN